MQTKQMQTGHKKYSLLPAADKAADAAAFLTEHKARDVIVLDLSDRSSFTDVMLVATANSVRHAQSLADGINRLCGEKNYEYLRMDGYSVGQWILVDCNDFVVNIFQPESRELYSLESLWSVPQSREELQQMAGSAASAASADGADGTDDASAGEAGTGPAEDRA